MQVIKQNNKYNYLREDDTYLSNEWFDYCDNFYSGFARVILDGKWNYIKENGAYLSVDWFEVCGIFVNGYSSVKKDYKWNLLKKDGTYLSNEWFDSIKRYKPSDFIFGIGKTNSVYLFNKTVKVKLID